MPSSFASELKQGLVHLFYPRVCEGCSKPMVAGEEVLCVSCALELPETNYHHIHGNETEVRLSGLVPFHRATSYAYFTNDGLLQHLLHGLKYRGRTEIGYFLGRRLGSELQNVEWARTIDLIMPVPLHTIREAKRGYNQSMIIAEGIAERVGAMATDKYLIRKRNTQTQTNKTRIERADNMEDMFAVKHADTLAGKHVLICDDVLTSGATLAACAAALSDIKNVQISIASIGIAVS